MTVTATTTTRCERDLGFWPARCSIGAADEFAGHLAAGMDDRLPIER
jgi:hypothetical protein